MGLLAGFSLPCIELLRMGQISGWLALGASLTVLGIFNNSAFLLAIGIGLCAFKPHIFLITFITLLGIFIKLSQYRRTIIVAIFSLIVSVLIIGFFTEATIKNWLFSIAYSKEVASYYTPTYFISSSIADCLSQVIDSSNASLKVFLRLFLCLSTIFIWFCYLIKVKDSYDFRSLLPLSICVSFVAAPYCWIFDFCTLLVIIYPILFSEIFCERDRNIKKLTVFFLIFFLLIILPFRFSWYSQFWYYPVLSVLVLILDFRSDVLNTRHPQQTG
jgi:hypothetical protein